MSKRVRCTSPNAVVPVNAQEATRPPKVVVVHHHHHHHAIPVSQPVALPALEVRSVIAPMTQASFCPDCNFNKFCPDCGTCFPFHKYCPEMSKFCPESGKLH